MSISAPGSGPRSARSSPRSSTCPLPASRWCWAIPRGFPIRAPTIASETIQVAAVPLRKAAAQARQFLIARAAERLELAVAELAVDDGLIRGGDNRSVTYGELIEGETIRLELADEVPLKPVDSYRIVGQSMPRVDLPAKATGEAGLCSRHARARHAAWPRGAAALCRRRRRSFCRHQPDRGRRGLGPRYSGAGRGGDESAISSASSPSARKTRSRPPLS